VFLGDGQKPGDLGCPMLSISVKRQNEISLRRKDPGLDRRAVATGNRVTHHFCSSRCGNGRRAITRAIVHHNDLG
jgi:hypothetical protein